MAIDFKPLTITPVIFSLTEGTTIPAPLDSPPRTPVDGQSANAENTAPETSQEKSSKSNGSTPDSKEAPLSPQSATSQGSQQQRKVNGVRKFFSLRGSRHHDSQHNKLHKEHRNPVRSPDTAKLSYDNSRPTSPLSATDAAQSVESDAAATTPITLKHKRSAGWFNSATGRRKSNLFVIGRLDERIAQDTETSDQRKRKAGPPPPAIPELESFGVGLDGGEIGGAELFKDIGNDIKVEDLEESPKGTSKSPITDTPAKPTDPEKKPSAPEPTTEKSGESPAAPSTEKAKTEEPKAIMDISSSSNQEELEKPAAVESTAEPIVPETTEDKAPVTSKVEEAEAKLVKAQSVKPEAVHEPIPAEKADSATNVVLDEPVAAKEADETKESVEAKDPVAAKEPVQAPVDVPQEIIKNPAAEKQIEAPVKVEIPQSVSKPEKAAAPAVGVKEEVVERSEE
jgi:hypothetical protein